MRIGGSRIESINSATRNGERAGVGRRCERDSSPRPSGTHAAARPRWAAPEWRTAARLRCGEPRCLRERWPRAGNSTLPRAAPESQERAPKLPQRRRELRPRSRTSAATSSPRSARLPRSTTPEEVPSGGPRRGGQSSAATFPCPDYSASAPKGQIRIRPWADEHQGATPPPAG